MDKRQIIEIEANNWFKRNKDHVLEKHDFNHMSHLLKFITPDQEVLEVGSSFGYNLNFLRGKTKCRPFGLEPSKLAVDYGKELFPEIEIKSGIINDVDILGKKFDHIIIGFCLYLVDPAELLEIAYKIDKSLNKNGFIHIIDFDTKYPITKSYSHNDHFKTRKMDYSQVFLNFPNYFLVEKHSWSHEGGGFNLNPDERCSTVTLYKEF